MQDCRVRNGYFNLEDMTPKPLAEPVASTCCPDYEAQKVANQQELNWTRCIISCLPVLICVLEDRLFSCVITFLRSNCTTKSFVIRWLFESYAVYIIVLLCVYRSIGVRTLVSAGELSLSCARLLVGRVTALWLSRPLSVNQHGQLSHPSLRGR